jgi:hypothetical protein
VTLELKSSILCSVRPRTLRPTQEEGQGPSSAPMPPSRSTLSDRLLGRVVAGEHLVCPRAGTRERVLVVASPPEG